VKDYSYRISLTHAGRLNWFWEIEYESYGVWWRAGLGNDRMAGNGFTRTLALRKARRVLARYRTRMERWESAHRESVPA
jgi:hypothetical protein